MSSYKVIVPIFLLLLLSACGNQNSDANVKPSPVEEQPSEVIGEPEEVVEESEQEAIELSSFFMDDGTVANYEGKGNEYASYKARTQWHNKNTVSVYEDNGGTTVLRTYRITENSIDLIKEQGEYYDEFNPTDEELQALPKISTFLQLPIEEGVSFDNWAIISVGETLDTPFQHFENVIILEKIEESGATLRKYLVMDYGEIKREFMMDDGDSELKVTSTLQSVE